MSSVNYCGKKKKMSGSDDLWVLGQRRRIPLFVVLVLCNVLFCWNSQLIEAKSLDGAHHHHHSPPAVQSVNGGCSLIRQRLNTTLTLPSPSSSQAGGAICNGQCCDNNAEKELMASSTNNFRQILKHHTQSLRQTLESTANTYRDHVLQMSHQSENKTLNIFSQVYRRMSPFSRQPIHDLYSSIRSHILANSTTDSLNLEQVVRGFFVNLFPVAYHHVIHSEAEHQINGDFYVDYKNCLMRTFDDIQPFGDVPRDLAKSLQQAVGTATVFVRALDRAALVLNSAESLDTELLRPKCTEQLLKMYYCQDCNKGSRVKVCNGYCLNVLRGCLTQYVGSLDRPWTSFVDSIEQLENVVRSKDGIESVIRSLDGKLSEAIMKAMQNGGELEQRVKKSCGAPSFMPSESLAVESENRQPLSVQYKWISPPDAELLRFLVAIDKSRDFYVNIVASICKDDEYDPTDKSCWTGDRVGDYTQTVMDVGVASQKYNPEVPYDIDRTAIPVNELVDKLINLRQTVSNAISQHSGNTDSDHMQSDMAEGSTWNEDTNDDTDFDKDLDGSGSGEGPSFILPDVTTIAPRAYAPVEPKASGSWSLFSSPRISALFLTTTIVSSLLVPLFSTSHFLLRDRDH